MMVGFIDVGGGLRDIYGAGVLDTCLEKKIRFDRCYGISAGAANLLVYLAGQKGYARSFYLDYTARPECMSLEHYRKTGSFINMDYIFGEMIHTDGEHPLKYDAVERSDIRLSVAAVDAATGTTHYFTNRDIHRDCYDVIKASCSLPPYNRPYPIDGKLYYDGGMADPVPLQKALNDGCDRIVLVLTRPREARRKWISDLRAILKTAGKYPKTAKSILRRASVYNNEIAYAEKLQEEGKVLILAPDTIQGMKTLRRNRQAMEALYREGTEDAIAIEEFINTTGKDGSE